MVCGTNSDAGKSTVVNTISGLLAAKAGDIRFDGATLNARPAHARASVGIAHVLERRRVFPHLTVLQNLTLGAWHAAAKAARAQSLERVFSLFPRLSEYTGRVAGTLSGGEQQMLALGRGLMALPRLLMVDEPFLGLAPRVVEQMRLVFQALQREGIAILFIEQNVRLALSMAGRGYVLESGRLAIEGAVLAYEKIVCANAACPNFQTCHPVGIEPGTRIRVLDVGPELECPLGYSLVSAKVAYDD